MILVLHIYSCSQYIGFFRNSIVQHSIDTIVGQFDNSTGLPKDARVISKNDISLLSAMNDLKKVCQEKAEEELSKLEKYLTAIATRRGLDFGTIYILKEEHAIKIEKALPILKMDSVLSRNFEEGSIKKYQQKLEVYKRVALEDLCYKFGGLASISDKKIEEEDLDDFVTVYKVSLKTRALADNDFQFYQNEFTKSTGTDAYHIVDQTLQDHYSITLQDHYSIMHNSTGISDL